MDHDKMSDWESLGPEAKADRLRQLVSAGEPVGVVDHSGADLRGAELRRAALRRAYLREANLAGANLREADLERADLREANLAGADAREADLERAILVGANLGRANLKRANLWGADLRGADLRGADLRGADLRGADLRGADLRGAKLAEASLWGADLRGTDLAAVELKDPYIHGTIVDRSTFEMSQWRPEFLAQLQGRGAAIGEDLADVLALATPPGLTLFFPKRIELMSKALVEAALAAMLGEGHAVDSSYQELELGGACVRLTGLPMTELARLADALDAYFRRPSEAVILDAMDGRQEAVMKRHTAAVAVLSGQLGDQVRSHVDKVFARIERTEAKLSPELVAALNAANPRDVVEKLAGTGWDWDKELGSLVRQGAWDVSTGAAGSGVGAGFATFIVWALTLAG